MSDAQHAVLIVEDDRETARELARYVRALGMRAIVAMTLAELERAIEAGGFCLVILDKELPASEEEPPLLATGDTALRWLAACDARRNGDDQRLLQILILTRVNPTPSFISAQHRMGASDFIPKPATPEVVTTAILDALLRAGRRDHAQCVSNEVPAEREAPREASRDGAPQPVVLEIDGKRVGRGRTSFLVDGRRADLQDGEFMVILRLAALRHRKSMDHLSSSDLGIYRTPHVPSRIRAALEAVMPEGVTILPKGEPGIYRLHPIVEVASIDWVALEKHPHAGIQGIAAAERKRR